MTTKRYWCPMCGDVPATPTMGIALLVMHKADCIGFHAIPVVEPLDVPEETTWGESGGAEAVWWRPFLGGVVEKDGRCAYRDGDVWTMIGPGVCRDTDIVTAINYVAGVRR